MGPRELRPAHPVSAGRTHRAPSPPGTSWDPWGYRGHPYLVRESGIGGIRDVDRGWRRHRHDGHDPDAQLLSAHLLQEPQKRRTRGLQDCFPSEYGLFPGQGHSCQRIAKRDRGGCDGGCRARDEYMSRSVVIYARVARCPLVSNAITLGEVDADLRSVWREAMRDQVDTLLQNCPAVSDTIVGDSLTQCHGMLPVTPRCRSQRSGPATSSVGNSKDP